MLVETYNQDGKKLAQTRLSKQVFGLKVEPDLVHQVVVAQQANRRQGTAHTKDRSEKRGGGTKPWRQKGTGRARHGSIRSPLWRGGGVTFGPRKERNYKKVIPTKMRRKALLMVLSAKAEKGLLLVLDKLAIEKAKTKQVFDILSKLPCKDKSVLIALAEYNKDIILASRNIAKTATIQAKDLNALDLLSYQYVLISKESIKIIEKTFVSMSGSPTSKN